MSDERLANRRATESAVRQRTGQPSSPESFGFLAARASRGRSECVAHKNQGKGIVEASIKLEGYVRVTSPAVGDGHPTTRSI